MIEERNFRDYIQIFLMDKQYEANKWDSAYVEANKAAFERGVLAHPTDVRFLRIFKEEFDKKFKKPNTP